MSAFFDTNILVYAAGTDWKAEVARDLLLRGGHVSVQVLNEFVNVSRRKMGHSWPVIEHALGLYRLALEDPLAMTDETHRLGVDIARKHGFHIYDSMIVASASLAGCGILYTEDLADGAVIAGVQIRNPFKPPPMPAL